MTAAAPAARPPAASTNSAPSGANPSGMVLNASAAQASSTALRVSSARTAKAAGTAHHSAYQGRRAGPRATRAPNPSARAASGSLPRRTTRTASRQHAPAATANPSSRAPATGPSGAVPVSPASSRPRPLVGDQLLSPAGVPSAATQP